MKNITIHASCLFHNNNNADLHEVQIKIALIDPDKPVFLFAGWCPSESR